MPSLSIFLLHMSTPCLDPRQINWHPTLQNPRSFTCFQSLHTRTSGINHSIHVHYWHKSLYTCTLYHWHKCTSYNSPYPGSNSAVACVDVYSLIPALYVKKLIANSWKKLLPCEPQTHVRRKMSLSNPLGPSMFSCIITECALLGQIVSLQNVHCEAKLYHYRICTDRPKCSTCIITKWHFVWWYNSTCNIIIEMYFIWVYQHSMYKPVTIQCINKHKCLCDHITAYCIITEKYFV